MRPTRACRSGCGASSTSGSPTGCGPGRTWRDETVGFQLEQACRLRARARPAGPARPRARRRGGRPAGRGGAGRAAARRRRGGRASCSSGRSRWSRRTTRRAPALLVQLGATLVEAGRLADADRRLDAAIALAAARGRPAARRAGPRRARARAPARRPQHRREARAASPTRRSPSSSAMATSSAAAGPGGCGPGSSGRPAGPRPPTRPGGTPPTLARRAGDERELFEILGWRASAAVFGPTPVPEAIRRCEGFRAQAAGSPVAVAFALQPLGVPARDDGRLRAGARAGRRRRTRSSPSSGAWSRPCRTTRRRSSCSPAGPTRPRRGCAPATRRSSAWGSATCYATTAADCSPRRCMPSAGPRREAAALCAASERCAAPEDVATQAMWRGVRAQLLAAEGEHAAAEALARGGRGADRADRPAQRPCRRAPRPAPRSSGSAGATRRPGRIRERAVALYEAKGNRVSAARARSWPAVPAPA